MQRPITLRFQTFTLTNHPHGELVHQILEAALQAADPGAAVERNLSIANDVLTAGDQHYNLTQVAHIYLVGAGKAGAPMALAAAAILGERLTAGLVIVKEGYEFRQASMPPQLKIVAAGHPLPDQGGVDATRELLSLVSHIAGDSSEVFLFPRARLFPSPPPAAGSSLPDLQHLT